MDRKGTSNWFQVSFIIVTFLFSAMLLIVSFVAFGRASGKMKLDVGEMYEARKGEQNPIK